MIDNLKELRNWFKKNRADLPWRPAHIDDFRDPYIVWISETMLQQTQVTTVVEYFLRWLKKFPTVQNLAIASEQEVFSLWQGLGYYSRARNILRTAKLLAEKYNGQFPTFRKDLENLPGIGAYTAGAILSMAYHKNEAILDGNLIRIFSRYYLIDFLPIDKVGRDIYWQHAIQIASQSKAYIHNEALMELGGTV